MNRILAALCIVLVFLLAGTGAALAQNDEDGTSSDDSFILKVNGSTTIASGEAVDGALIIRGDIVVDGTINEGLILYDGTATINGTVNGEIVIASGVLVLNAGSTVDDVMLFRSELTQDPGATVTGSMEQSDHDFEFGRGLAVFSILWWIGMLIAGIVAAIVFAWLGRAQLFGAVETLRSSFVGSLITAIILFIVLPILAVLILFTLVGAPLALSILFVVLPILLTLGLIVFGTWIASYIIKGTSTAAAIGTAVLGVILLALASLIPFVGIVVFLAGLLGAGALVYRAFKRATTGALPQQV